MDDPVLAALLAGVTDNDLDALLILSDYLEEHGDPRAPAMRRLHATLYDHWMFAPFAFRHFQVSRHEVLALFPEYEG
jgi:hypothetical protein